MSSPEQLTPTPSREPATVRIAMWSARHRWPVVGLWFAGHDRPVRRPAWRWAGSTPATPTATRTSKQLEASEAYDVFNAGGKLDPSEQFLVVVDGGPAAATDPAFQASVETIVGQLHGASAEIDGVTTPTFDQLLDPFEAPPAAGLISADGTTVRIVTRVPGDDPHGPRAAGARPADRRRRPRGQPRPAHPRRQPDVHLRRHQQADLERSRRHAQDHDAADLLHPAARLRRHRRVGRAARPGRRPRCSRRSGSSASTARSWAPSARTRRS